MKTRIHLLWALGISLGLPFPACAQAQPLWTNIASAGEEAWSEIMLGIELKSAAWRLDRAAKSSTAARLLDRIRLGSLRAMVEQSAPGGQVDRALEASSSRLAAEATKHRVQANEPGLSAERRDSLNQLAVAIIERRLSETRQLRRRLTEEHVKLKAQLEHQEQSVEVNGSAKLEAIDAANESLRRATRRLDGRAP